MILRGRKIVQEKPSTGPKYLEASFINGRFRAAADFCRSFTEENR